MIVKLFSGLFHNYSQIAIEKGNAPKRYIFNALTSERLEQIK